MSSQQKLDVDGFAIIEGVVPEAQTDALREVFAGLGVDYGRRNVLEELPAVAQVALELRTLVISVLGQDAFVVRGIFFDKGPEANWQVTLHQDLSIAVAERREAPGFAGWSVKEGVVHVQPPAEILEAMLTVRLHLDDCGDENGPLRVIPGSHRHGRLTGAEAERFEREGSAMVCCVRKGGVLLMRPLLLHASARAIRPTHRRVLHLEYASGPLPHGLRWAVTTPRGGPATSRLLCLLLMLWWALSGGHAAFGARMEGVGLAGDGHGFVLAPSGRPFTPWGFNYDHDRAGRLLEDYWGREWPAVEEDFHEMRELGANVVRVHLQFGRFMTSAKKPNAAALRQLGRMLALAERTGLYLDLTGLGCYQKEDVPGWYDVLDERARWEAQAAFWSAVARTCASSPAIFCFDLMNEPVVAGARRAPGDWLGPPFGDKHYVQVITLDPAGRDPPEVARAWIRKLREAIRRHDRRHLITVGLVDWSLDRPGLRSGFVPSRIAGELDFLSVHLYPAKEEVGKALETLRGFAVGKPVVIEETFPLQCSISDFEAFVRGSGGVASGWIGFYWGKTPQELRESRDLADALMLAWLDYFQTHRPPFVNKTAP